MTVLVPPATTDSLARQRVVTDPLRAELDTDWIADPWGWSDLRGTTISLENVARWATEERVEPLDVEFVGGRPRRVPLLGGMSRLLLHEVAVRALQRAPALAPGVHGYRLAADGAIVHYRDAYAQRVASERRLVGRYPLIVEVDVRRFFPSVSLASLLEIAVGGDPSLAAAGEALFRRIRSAIGHPLPEGYAAARALANLALAQADEVITPWPFTRWLDDYRVFVSSQTEADDVVERLGQALSACGFEMAQEKVAVRESHALSEDGGRSLGCHEGDATDALVELEAALAAGGRQDRVERLLRHALRLDAEQGGTGTLELVAEAGAARLPRAVIPRLSWAIARCRWTPSSERVVEQLLSVSDEVSGWRLARLATALWYAPSHADALVNPHLVEALRSPPAVAYPALTRLWARHGGGPRPDPPTAGDDWSARRVAQLARRDIDDSAPPSPGPPVATFL